MTFLRGLFEDQLRLRIDANGSAIVGDTSFPAALILRSDPTAYEAEYTAWLYDNFIPSQLEILGAILSLYGNRRRFDDLVRAIERGQVVPLVGSGMSASSGLPTWSNFLRCMRRYSTLSEGELEHLLAEAAFEEAADRLEATMPRRLFDERIEHDLRLGRLSPISGAVRYLPSIFDDLVLTTNLDDILERLYADQSRGFGHVLIGPRINEYRRLRADTGSFLFKLHGDHRSTVGRVLGTEAYDLAYADGGAIRTELTLVYRTKSLLCLGCSLMADRTVSLIAETAATDVGMPRHYAFCRSPLTAEEQLAREQFLAERDIFPIWYDGDHDECISALFIGIAHQLERI